ncbi:MAG: rRNA (adenine-N6)-dimethyltransferase [Actinomycetota bacterium]|nr:rRNA (adenine-N6)-dimethyltransferase [Actinomycetota bacterium]
MGAGSRAPRASGSRPSGQHFLRSALIAAELVRDAHILPTDDVLEIGAGSGRLTAPLADRARTVTAVELDPVLIEALRERFDGRTNVRIVGGDVLRIPSPGGPWRAFGNIPFSVTTPILRRLLDDPSGGLQRADLLIQFEAARKRATSYPATLLSLGWLPWWEFSSPRRIPRSGFEPPPAVDAAVLVVTRRAQPLLPSSIRPAYVDLLRTAFDHGSWPVRRSLRAVVPPLTWKRLARERGLSLDARPPDLDVWDWVALYSVLRTPAPVDPAPHRR